RMANLQQLLDIARTFEQNGFRGLSAFVRYVDRESERENSTAPASLTEGQDAVHIMSIHASKGLEFPVVFLAGLGRQFNNRSAMDALLFHRELGVGMDLQNTDTLEKYDTVQRNALAQRIRRDARAEDLRVLYVALTRARERLCMVITGDTAAQLTAAAAAVGNAPHLPTGAVMEAGSYADWVLMALLRHPEANFLRALAGAEGLETLPCNSHLTVQALASPPMEEVAEEERPAPPVDEAYLAALRERLCYTYPFEALGAVPAKLAASALAHQQGERFVATSRPAFFSESALTPAERGTALHQFMQFANYEAAAADPAAECRRLVKAGFLTDVQGESLPLSRLRAFFGSDLYRRIKQSPRVLREYAFTVERPAELCVPGLSADAAAGETVLVQGIADCLFWEDDRWVIVDYKTDRVDSAAQLAERYRPQLALYAEALEQSFSEPVGECLLYSFALGQAVPVEL
ncbi:MAG: PD-(D/E)XK nuclease family protein, partial [Clostridia bacterium]|nr:PD-(D/E)XK nuclease family protein [Clostridia bacterium]